MLLVPSLVVGNFAQACCGVDVTDLQVTDEPDPACLGQTVTISGSYVAFSPWGEWTEDYDTGVEIRVFDSKMTMVDEYLETLGQDQPDPGDYPPGTEWAFSHDWTPTAAGTYTYEVIAWSETSWGRMEISVVGETIEAEVCMEIDIKPGSFPNSINPDNKGVIPVAILGSEDFDVSTVDPASITFGPTGAEAAPLRWAFEDVDSDGYVDIILHFKTQDCGFSAGDETGTLICDEGTASDTVNIVPKDK